MVREVITLIAKKSLKTFRENTEEQKNGAKMTIRGKVMHHVILSLYQSELPCQSDAPCHFVAVPK